MPIPSAAERAADIVRRAGNGANTTGRWPVPADDGIRTMSELEETIKTAILAAVTAERAALAEKFRGLAKMMMAKAKGMPHINAVRYHEAMAETYRNAAAIIAGRE